MSKFSRYIGIDYSGAQTPTQSLPGLRIYMADAATPPAEVAPPPSPRKYWTRKGIAHWLVERLNEEIPTLVGIDHGFSFPLNYFRKYTIKTWNDFLDDFVRHWPTDHDHMYVCFVFDGGYGDGAARTGDPAWKRLTEERTPRAKSVFRFDVQGTVAYSTHAGLPWLRYIRDNTHGRVHFWPFDGWTVPEGRSVVAEIYPALWNKTYPREERNEHQHDAWCVATWMRTMDHEGKIGRFFQPRLSEMERVKASLEGWILGVE